MRKKQLYNKATGEPFVPIGSTEAVYDSNGLSAEERLLASESGMKGCVPIAGTNTTKVSDTAEKLLVADGDGNVMAVVDAEGVGSSAFVVKDEEGGSVGKFGAAETFTVSGVQKTFSTRKDDALIVADGNGNVIATADKEGIGAGSFNIKDTDGGTAAKIDAPAGIALGGLAKDLTTRENNALYICDAKGNVCMSVTNNGVLDAAAVGGNLIQAVNEATGTGGTPSYLEEEYAKTLATVQTYADTGAFSFGFMTDLHFCNENTTYDVATKNKLRKGVKNAVYALQRFSREFPLATVVLNGDYQQHPTPNTWQMGVDCLVDVNKWMGGMDCPNIALCGNHEYSYSGNALSNANHGLSRAEIYTYLTRKYVKGEIKKAAERVLYQIDDADGVVFVYITTTGACATLGTSTPTAADIESDIKAGYDAVIAANTSNYPYILISHYSNDITYSGSTVSAYAVNSNVGVAIDYFAASGTVLAYFGGHCHSDWCIMHNTTPVVSCLQSGFMTNVPSQDGTTYAHTEGTATESAFTIITISKTTGQIHATRFGLGKDRTINYNSTSGTIGNITYTT